MPRANRYILPNHIYHVTHRCHNRQFLLRFARDRNEYRCRLRQTAIGNKVTVLTYCITSNHVHMLVGTSDQEQLSDMMQQLEGEFARVYNRRKKRTGAFWEGRYHSTMVEKSSHLWNCMVYIDLNMVRAGVISHPREWPWCGYQEISKLRTRYRIINFQMCDILMSDSDKTPFDTYYEECIAQGLCTNSPFLRRDATWTENIAVGSEEYVNEIAAKERHRMKLDIYTNRTNEWCVRECREAYNQFSGSKIAFNVQKTHK